MTAEELIVMLKARRISLGLSLTTVAKRMGVSHVTVHNIEKKKRARHPEIIEKYAEALGVNVSFRAEWTIESENGEP